MKMIELPGALGVCERIGRLDPIPPGPYLVFRQHEPFQNLDGQPFTKVQLAHPDMALFDEIPRSMYGKVAFACVDGKAKLAYYHFDTSG